MKCLICEKECKNNRSLGVHVARAHDMSINEYKEKFDLFNKCIVCGIRLSKNAHFGHCNTHRDRTGEKNSFYGKSHSEGSILAIKKKTSIASKKKWQDEVYRERVISGVSKPRRQSFKKEQSDRVRQWYEQNPDQRKIRSLHMKKSWADGKIVSSKNHTIKRSKKEKMLLQDIKNYVAHDAQEHITISDGKRWYFPDIVVDHVIIEFYGDYWHMNPSIYDPESYCEKLSLSASEIWERDDNRRRGLMDLGYDVHVVWELDYKKHKQIVLSRIDALVNWESCSF